MTRVNTKSVAPKVIKAKLADHDNALDNLEGSGTIPSARLKLATNPTANDTVTIDGHVFKFVAALGAADTFTQVKILGSAALTRAAFVKAINGTAAVTDWKEATTPFDAAVVADAIDTDKVRLRLADERGGSAVAAAKADADLAVAETLTAGADVWDRANLEETGQADALTVAISSVTITAQMVTAGKVYIEFPFTPLDFTFTAKSALGVVRATDDLIAIEGNAIKIPLAGGSSPNLQATDIVTVCVVG